MSEEERVEAFNPLQELGVSRTELNRAIVDAFEDKPCDDLPEPYNPFYGCGVYALYYFGDYPRYEPVSNDDSCDIPIYVGKAVPSGSRTGGAHLESSTGKGVYNRLREHRRTIEAAENLNVDNVQCRYLVTSSIWIRYIEQTLISYYMPWWNRYIDGFGNHDPGDGRYNQDNSIWDTLHPGREWAERLNPIGSPDEVWRERVQPRLDAEWNREDVGVLPSEEEQHREEETELGDVG